MKLPTWKILREVNRLVKKPKNIFDLLLSPLIQSRIENSSKSVIHDGTGLCSPNMAILLLYAPDGVQDDYYRMLDYLEKNNISAVIVSQLPLHKRDLVKLTFRARLIIERPNFGYDFGGYREGVLTLLNRGYSLRNLFIVNDSIWFPMSCDSDLIEAALCDSSDLYGIYMNDQRKKPHQHHLQSYFYRFGPNLTQHSDFENYWRKLIVYNNKDLTVRRNEMRLTNWFQDRGHQIGYRYNTSDLQHALLDLSVSERYALAKYQILIGDKYANHIQKKITTNAYADNATYVADVKAGILGRYFMITHPAVLIDRLKCPILKRDKRYPYQVQRTVLLSESCSEFFPDTLRVEMLKASDNESSKSKFAQLVFSPKKLLTLTSNNSF